MRGRRVIKLTAILVMLVRFQPLLSLFIFERGIYMQIWKLRCDFHDFMTHLYSFFLEEETKTKHPKLYEFAYGAQKYHTNMMDRIVLKHIRKNYNSYNERK